MPSPERSPASIYQLAGLIAVAVTLVGSGITSLFYLAGIQGDIRVLQTQQTNLAAQFDKLEKSYSRPPDREPLRR